VSLLEARERTRLAALTECSEEDVERILLAAASERIVILLPSFHSVGDFAGWETFVIDGGAKSAHLAERDAVRALCGAARPGSALTDVAARVRLCVGCEAHALRLTEQPERIARYDRGAAPPPTLTLPVTPFRRPGAGTDAVVRLLVERGISVYEIAQVEPTLEDFYLSLMNGQKEAKS